MTLPVDLTKLIPLEDGYPALEAFVSTCLADGGVWSTPRESDGISNIERVLERAPDRLRLYGRIFTIDQELHPFWLEMSRDAAGSGATWVLYFEVIERSERRARNALTSSERADELEWGAVLKGEARIDNGVFTPVPGATRAVVPDAESVPRSI